MHSDRRPIIKAHHDEPVAIVNGFLTIVLAAAAQGLDYTACVPFGGQP